MTRLGIVIGGLFALGGAAFLSMTTLRTAPEPRGDLRAAVAAPPPSLVDRVRGLVMPVLGHPRERLYDSWGDARSGGRGHRGIDLVAAEGTPVVAAVDGTVEKLFESRLGGTTLYLRSADRKWTYYYAHLASYASGVREGLRVRAGQVLGYVGDTGDAGKGNYHLHFSTTRMAPGQRWWQGEDVNPYPLLADREGRR